MRCFFCYTLFVATSLLRAEDHPVKQIVAAERAFAQLCSEKGIRASFLTFFADDAIAFYPQPEVYKEAIKKRPTPANPLAISLQWEPQVAGISSSEDLGYTTGPSFWSDATTKESPKYYGLFFSVWKKQKDNTWKVVLDIGTQTPVQTAPLGTSCKETKGSSSPATSKKLSREQMNDVLSPDFELSKSSESEGVVKAYGARIVDDSRLHRENEMPMVGIDAIQSYLNKQSVVPTWSPIAGDVSVAGDLGYTYGNYECKAANAPIAEHGYYFHMWRRDEKGDWKLVAEVAKRQDNKK